ncbi:MAG: DUF111 family protein [Coriobacteriales bacterium]|jgi:uncharacterized protein (TIGR00299 family) protein|nr:DUF111 family protein [Coriobacteriales bacterium]
MNRDIDESAVDAGVGAHADGHGAHAAAGVGAHAAGGAHADAGVGAHAAGGAPSGGTAVAAGGPGGSGADGSGATIIHLDFSTGASGDKILGALLEVCETLGVADFEDLQRLADALVPGLMVFRERVNKQGIAATQIRVADEQDAPHRHWHDIRTLIQGVHAQGVLSHSALTQALAAFEAVARAEAAVHDTELEHVHFHEVGAADSIVDIVCASFLFAALAPRAVYATPLALGNGTVHCAHGELAVPAPATARLIEGLPVYASAHEGELTTPTGAALARTFVTHWEALPPVRPRACGWGAGTRELAGAANVVRVLVGARVGGVGCAEGVSVAGGAAGAGGADATGGAGAAGAAGQGGASEPSCAEAAFYVEGCVLLESNIDHLSAEALAFACEELLAAGALDVWLEPIVMKKGRLASRLSVLASPTHAQTHSPAPSPTPASSPALSPTPASSPAPAHAPVPSPTPLSAPASRLSHQGLAEHLMALTGSLGVRRRFVERIVAPREIVTYETRFGPVPFKVARFLDPSATAIEAASAFGATTVGATNGAVAWLRPEHEAVARIAREQALDYAAVAEELYREALRQGGGPLPEAQAVPKKSQVSPGSLPAEPPAAEPLAAQAEAPSGPLAAEPLAASSAAAPPAAQAEA